MNAAAHKIAGKCAFDCGFWDRGDMPLWFWGAVVFVVIAALLIRRKIAKAPSPKGPSPNDE